MSRWLLLLGGLVVWTIHFLGVYAIASIADVVDVDDAPAARWAVGGFTLACAGADVLIGLAALRRSRPQDDSLDRFIHRGALWCAGLSFVAVVWQGLPALVGR